MRKYRWRDFAGFICYHPFMSFSKRAVIPLLLLFILVQLPGCHSCEHKPAIPLLDRVPVQSQWVVAIPSIASALDSFGLYVEQVSRGPSRALVRRLRAGLETQAGVKFFRPATWEKAGVDTGAGMVAFDYQGKQFAWVRVKSAEPFENMLATLLARLDGATKLVKSSHHGVAVVTFGRPFGTDVVPVLSYASIGGDYLLAFGNAASVLAQVVAKQDAWRANKKLFNQDPRMLRLIEKSLNAEMRMFGPSDFAKKLIGDSAQVLSDGVALSVDFGATGLKVDAFVDFKLPNLEKVFPKTTVFEHARLVDQDGAVILLTNAARPEVLNILQHQPIFKEFLSDVKLRSLKRQLSLGGVDLTGEAMGFLKGPVALAVHLQDVPTLYKRLQAGERRLRVLLDSVQVAAVAQVKNVEKIKTLMSQSEKALAARGMRLRSQTISVNDKSALLVQPDKASARVGWGLAEGYYFYGAGLGRAEKIARHLLHESPAAADIALASSVVAPLAREPGTQVVVVRSKVVAQAVSELLKQTKLPGIAQLGLAQQADILLGLVGAMDDIALGLNTSKDGIILKLRQKL